MSLESDLPIVFEQLLQAGEAAERLLMNVAELEFTVDSGRLFICQLRTANLKGYAKVVAQIHLFAEGKISPEEVLKRITPLDMAEVFRPQILNRAQLKPLGTGLGIGGGSGSGKALIWNEREDNHDTQDHPRLLLVSDLAPKCWGTFDSSLGVLATYGGVNCHAALQCRQLGKPCVVGFREGKLDPENRTLIVSGHSPINQGDWLTIDGATGEVFAGMAEIGPRPWSIHPELQMLWLMVEGALSSGRVPDTCTGAVWRIWDYVRHALPLPNQPGATDPTVLGIHRHPISNLCLLAPERRSWVCVDPGTRWNYSDIVLGLITTLDRLLHSVDPAVPCCRVLWDPSEHIDLCEGRQWVGIEFYRINRYIPHLIAISTVRILFECAVASPSEAWILGSVRGTGWGVVAKSRTIKACRIIVNGATLEHEDIPCFYNWLRRREYFSRWFEENRTSHAELRTFLENYERSTKVDQRLSELCCELDLIKNSRLTASGMSLMGLEQ